MELLLYGIVGGFKCSRTREKNSCVREASKTSARINEMTIVVIPLETRPKYWQMSLGFSRGQDASGKTIEPTKIDDAIKIRKR